MTSESGQMSQGLYYLSKGLISSSKSLTKVGGRQCPETGLYFIRFTLIINMDQVSDESGDLRRVIPLIPWAWGELIMLELAT